MKKSWVFVFSLALVLCFSFIFSAGGVSALPYAEGHYCHYFGFGDEFNCAAGYDGSFQKYETHAVGCFNVPEHNCGLHYFVGFATASGGEFLCYDPTATCCVPSCSEKICGVDDGCGVACQAGSGCCVSSPEICDGQDNNCNGIVDEGCPFGYLDSASCAKGLYGWVRDSRTASGAGIINDGVMLSRFLNVSFNYSSGFVYNSAQQTFLGIIKSNFSSPDVGAHRFIYYPLIIPGAVPGNNYTFKAFGINNGSNSSGNPELTNIQNFTIHAEICNGLDDNCNGQIDENVCTGTNAVCSGGLPANANWNDNGLNGNFTQVLNTSGTWVPVSLGASFNTNVGDCHYKCNTNYSWDSSTSACIRNTIAISTCSDITARVTCENTAGSVAFNSVPDSSRCDKTTPISPGVYNKTNCICSWDSSTSTCRPAYDFTKVDTNTKINSSYGICSFTTTTDNQCSSAAATIITNYKATCSPVKNPCSQIDSACVDSTKSFACPITEQLPFFGGFEFMITLVAVVFFYSILFRKK